MRDRTISVSRKRVTRAKLLRKFHERGGDGVGGRDGDGRRGGSSMDRGAALEEGAVEKGAHTLRF